MKKALITGVTGQDSAYPVELLLENGFEVHGIKRRASSFNTQRVDHIYENVLMENARLKLHHSDLSDSRFRFSNEQYIKLVGNDI
jgi:GDPmannose 4,6-dehydratase